jgi:hypothetical protein
MSEARRLAFLLRRLEECRTVCNELRTRIASLHGAVTGERESLKELEELVREGEAALEQLAADDATAQDERNILDSISILEKAVSDSRWDSASKIDGALKSYRELEDDERKQDMATLDELAKLVARYREALEGAREVLAATREDEQRCAAFEAMVAQVRRDLGDNEQYEAFATGIAKLAREDLESWIAKVGASIREAGVHWQLAELILIKSAGAPPDYEVILRMPGESGNHGLSVRGTSHVTPRALDALYQRARKLDGHVAVADGGARRDAGDAGIALPEADGRELAGRIGEELYDLVIPPFIKSYLERVRCSLTISTNDLDLPLELLCTGEERSFLSLERPISRMLLGTSADRGYRRRRQSPTRPKLRFLLIGANGRNDLPEVPLEISRIQHELHEAFGNTIEVDTPAATEDAFFDAIKSGNYHVIHFAGHGEYDPVEPARSKLILDDGTIPAGMIENTLRGNPVVFLNGCKTTAMARSESLAPAEGLSAAFIYGGALGCIGNTWPIHDRIAADFAASFYKHLVRGHTLGKAMLYARKDTHYKYPTRLTWAGFVLFGNPLFRMTWSSEQRFSY